MLPLQPKDQKPTVPWGGNITIEKPNFYMLGKRCIGQNLPEGEYGYGTTCPQVRIQNRI